MSIFEWVQRWNDCADRRKEPYSLRAVYLDPEMRHRDNYDPTREAQVNALSLYVTDSLDEPMWRVLTDFHNVAEAKAFLQIYTLPELTE